MKKLSFHILFWVFIAFYVFDYLIDLFNLKSSIAYTLFEVSTNALEFYINLFFLLPMVLEKKGKALYISGVIILLSCTYFIFFITGLHNVLLSLNFTRGVISFLLNHSFYILISFFVWHFNKFELEKQKRLLLENEKLQTEALLLKTQISPHFLFNALNNIYTLTLLKNDDAPKMLSTLSDILRYFLYEGTKQYVFLESEIEIAEKYIQIQKYRQIPGMNNISFRVIGNSSGLKVPPLIYMTLIENAFKHSDIIEDEKGFVDINFSIHHTQIELSIINSFVPKEKNNGIGLKNVRSQLDLLFEKNYNISLSEDNHTFKINLIINGSY